MADTKIEWTDKTWNPITGCNPVSAGCENCYAKGFFRRHRGRFGYPSDDPSRVTFHHERLKEPLKWKKVKKIFVCSMSDLFHEDVDFKWIAAIFGVMAACPHHTFQLLTKRPERALEFFKWIESVDWPHQTCNDIVLSSVPPVDVCLDCAADYITDKPPTHLEVWWPDDEDYPPWPLPNVWVGVTAENQEMADKRIPLLIQIPAAIRFVSCEPLLSNINLHLAKKCNHCDAYSNAECPGSNDLCAHENNLDWVIVGGEKGHGARPMHPNWARSIRDQCVEAGTPFFFKQWGKFAPVKDMDADHALNEFRVEKYSMIHRYVGDSISGQPWFGDLERMTTEKKDQCKHDELDGVEWKQFPEVE